MLLLGEGSWKTNEKGNDKHERIEEDLFSADLLEHQPATSRRIPIGLHYLSRHRSGALQSPSSSRLDSDGFRRTRPRGTCLLRNVVRPEKPSRAAEDPISLPSQMGQ